MKNTKIFKILIVLSLVLILSLSLFACNKGGDKDNGGTSGGGGTTTPPATDKVVTIEGSKYITFLDKAVESMGKDEIASGDDMRFNFDMFLDFEKVAKNDDVLGQFGVGLDVEIILDRASSADDQFAGKNTAAKLSFYNPAKGKVDGKVFELSFFMNDSSAIYFEMNGQKAKIGFDTGYNVEDRDDFGPDYYGNILANALESSGVNAIIGQIAGVTGDDWNIDKTITILLNLIQVGDKNIEDIIAGVDSGAAGIPDAIKPIIAALKTMFYDKDNNFQVDIVGLIDKILGFSTVLGFGEITQTSYASDANLKTYNLPLGLNTIGGLVGGQVDNDMLRNALKTVIGSGKYESLLDIQFDTYKNEMDGMQIALDLKGLTQNKGEADEYRPKVVLGIANIDISATDSGKAVQTLGVNKSNYSDTFSFETSTTATIQNFIIQDDNGNNLSLDGRYQLKANACIDLLNKVGNKTRASIVLTSGSATALNIELVPDTNDTLQLIAEFNNSTEFAGFSVEMIIGALRTMLANSPNGSMFKNISNIIENAYADAGGQIDVIVCKNIKPVDLFQTALRSATDSDASAQNDIGTFDDLLNGANSAYLPTNASSATNNAIELNFSGIFGYALNAISFDKDGTKLGFSVANALDIINGAVLGFEDDINYKMGAIVGARSASIVGLTNLGIIDTVNVKGAEHYKNANDLSRAELLVMYDYMSGKKGWSDYQSADYNRAFVTENMFNEVFAKIAPYLSIKGILQLNGMCADGDVLKALLGTKIDVSVDLATKLAATMKISLGNSSITLDSYTQVKAGSVSTSATLPDGLVDGANDIGGKTYIVTSL